MPERAVKLLSTRSSALPAATPSPGPIPRIQESRSDPEPMTQPKEARPRLSGLQTEKQWLEVLL